MLRRIMLGMDQLATLALPLVSVLLGGLITYLANVRQRRTSKVEDVYHEAIAAVAVAQASHDWIGSLGPWMNATPADHDALLAQLGRDGNLNYARAVADARSALARASAYDPSLAQYVQPATSEVEVVYARADEIMAHLRRNIDARRSRLSRSRIPPSPT